jgi:benzoyl-CoA reductase subunit C
LKFCDLWGGEIYIIRKESKKSGFPVLALERELYGAGEGQVRTRIQAFFEQIRNSRGVDQEMLKAAGSNYTVKE